MKFHAPFRNASLLLLCLFALLAGCLPAYVGDPATATLDPKLVGIWHEHRSGDGNETVWFLDALDAHGYMVRAYEVKRGDDGKYTSKQTLTAHAWLADISGAHFISMRMFSVESSVEPEKSKDRYLVARYELTGDTLTVRGVDRDAAKEAATPEALTKLIADRLHDDKLFAQEQTYERINLDKDGRMQELLSALKE